MLMIQAYFFYRYNLTWLWLWTGITWLNYELSKDKLREIRFDLHPSYTTNILNISNDTVNKHDDCMVVFLCAIRNLLHCLHCNGVVCKVFLHICWLCNIVHPFTYLIDNQEDMKLFKTQLEFFDKMVQF